MSKNGQEDFESLIAGIADDVAQRNKIYDDTGNLDARAFKRLMYEQEAGTATGSKAFMAGATAAAGGYAPDSYLLNGLAVHGVTFQ